MTELITEKTTEYIRKRDDDRPFFVYAAYNAPHYPMHAPETYMERYAHLTREIEAWRRTVSEPR